MPRGVSKHPTQLEHQILKVLWNHGEAMLARDVQAALAAEGRELAKTSVITTLNTMVDKKYLKRKPQGNSYLFSPRVTEDQVGNRVLEDVVDRVFSGSAAAVLMKLFDVKDLDANELRELRDLIDAKLKDDRTS